MYRESKNERKRKKKGFFTLWIWGLSSFRVLCVIFSIKLYTFILHIRVWLYLDEWLKKIYIFFMQNSDVQI